MPMQRVVTFTAIMAAAVFALPALAQGPPDYGLNWMTIGDPHNRPTRRSEVPLSPWMRLGRVGHQYRLTQTELTSEQWLPFVQAYAPFFDGFPADVRFTSHWISLTAEGGFRIAPGYEQAPAQMGWRIAARYCNWLHNGRVNEAWAFDSGAYDTSTFTRNPDGSYNDQAAHSPGARYWIPTLDEWMKGSHYDPDRYGEGAGGYWFHPNGSDDELISGYPWDGGETNAGDGLADWGLFAFPAGQYPGISAPWGLLDVSGGAREWTETAPGAPDDARLGLRWIHGSGFGSPTYMLQDRIDLQGAAGNVTGSTAGLRIAAVIPAPPVFGAGAVVVFTLARRRTW